jgi:subtilisin family serine protease
VVAEMASPATPQAIAALALRNNLTLIDQLASQLTGTTLLLLRIPDQRPLAAVIGALQTDAAVLSAQPNYLFALQDERAAGGDALQYASLKLRLPEAHKLAAGDNVLVGVIDSGIDARHPELAGSIAATFDAIGRAGGPHDHGTAIAGLIVAHGRLTGTAPRARLLAVRAFDADGTAAQGTTFNILKGLDWMAVKGARVINMSFAGPSDPAIHRGLEGAFRNGIMLIAAAGNAGPKSPPLFPGADPDVLAVTATDAADRIFAASNRGGYIAVAAPGVDVLVAAPDGSYQVSSGTSFSAAEVSGIAALMIQKHPDLTPQAVRVILMSTAKPLKQGSDPRLADAYQAVASQESSRRNAGR